MPLHRRLVMNLIIVAVFAFFSYPMVDIMSYHYLNGIYIHEEPSYPLLMASTIFSPWALLITTAICYHRKLRLQAYVAGGLFFWAVLTQLLNILLFYLSQGYNFRFF